MDAWRDDRRGSGMDLTPMAKIQEEGGDGDTAGQRSGSEAVRLTNAPVVFPLLLRVYPEDARHRILVRSTPALVWVHPTG